MFSSQSISSAPHNHFVLGAVQRLAIFYLSTMMVGAPVSEPLCELFCALDSIQATTVPARSGASADRTGHGHHQSRLEQSDLAASLPPAGEHRHEVAAPSQAAQAPTGYRPAGAMDPSCCSDAESAHGASLAAIRTDAHAPMAATIVVRGTRIGTPLLGLTMLLASSVPRAPSGRTPTVLRI